MKIALINPPEENRVYTEVPSKVNMKYGHLPPLGLLYLESYLHHHTNHTIKMFDCPANETGHEDLEKELKSFAPDMIGITGHSHNLLDMLQLSRYYKKMNPQGVVVWGGPHSSAFPKESLTFPEVDYAVFGEGEITLKELVDYIDKKEGDLSKIFGLVYRNNGETVQNPARPYLMELDTLPHPRRTVLDINKYSYAIGQEVRATSFVSSRGCPYQCTFCSTPGKVFRARGAKDVVDEMEECHKMGIGELYFVDDTFNVDKQRVMDICNEILKRGLKINWNFRGRINLITEEMLKIAEKAGCTRIQLGIETGTDEGMKRLKKGITVEQVRQVFKWIKKTKMLSAGYFMIGSPHEKTRDDIMKTVNFAKEIDPDYVLFGILTPYPHTEIYDEGVAKKLIDPAIWNNFVTNPSTDFAPQPWLEHFTLKELEEMIDIAYKKFYGRPTYMLKRLMDIKSPRDFWQKLKAGVNILK